MRSMRTFLKCSIWCLFLLYTSGIELKDAHGDERATVPPTIGHNTVEVLSYQDSGYRFHIFGLDETPPPGFEQPDFDDTAFDVGSGAFGSRGTCDLQSLVQTSWPVNRQLVVRRVIDLPTETTNVQILVSVDNDIVGIFFNGTPLSGFAPHDECPILDEFAFAVPQELVRPGANVVVFHVLDRGVESFFGTRILADRPKSRILEAGTIQGTINGQTFSGRVAGRWDLLDQGGMVARVTAELSNLPPGFSMFASSGLSWLSWSNSCTPPPKEPPKPSPKPKPKESEIALTSLSGCDSLHGWNYALERENVFPDGNRITMKFWVSRIGPEEITMSSRWDGNYALGTDIVFIEQPIVEELVSEAPGIIRGFYRYILIRSDGTRIPVDTFSRYTFTPLAGSDGLLPEPQKRVTTNAWFLEADQRRLTVIGQGAMLPAREPISLEVTK
jgi:hypothetical protein